VLLFSVAGMPSLISAQPQEQGLEQPQQQANSQAQNGTRIVEVGGGGPISVVTWFNPQNVSIKLGETVTWKNPTIVSEPHTVSFLKQQDYFANVESPYLIANGTELTPANPDEQNTEAIDNTWPE
jgi:plastocyanin